MQKYSVTLINKCVPLEKSPLLIGLSSLVLPAAPSRKLCAKSKRRNKKMNLKKGRYIPTHYYVLMEMLVVSMMHQLLILENDSLPSLS